MDVRAIPETVYRVLVIAATWLSVTCWSAETYRPINPTMADKMITLTGQDLSIDQLVQIARYCGFRSM
jgi:hypothetical protein